MSRCGLLYDPVFLDHHTGHGHPECPDRVSVAYQAIKKAGLVQKSISLKPQVCQAEALERVHSKSYLSQAEKDIKAKRDAEKSNSSGIPKELLSK